ncbi:MAG: hypothetical protein QOG43_450, partial [Actinomycetota bacterium]|nr:hypothetical protein [Actinomycetota bacterium]
LGTGGWHFVHWNLARDSWSEPGPGTVMKLRYTSLQVDTGAAEEDGGVSVVGVGLGGRPVVACTLHSQVGCVAAAFDRCAPRRRLVYVMTDSAALPLALSDLVFDLRQRELLAATVTCGQAFGGDHEAVSVPSALLVATTVARADAIVVGPGPGVVGTGSEYGFGGVEVAAVVDVAAHLGGRPIVAVRYSDADARDRHRGVSHHTTTTLALAACRPLVVVPRGRGGRDGLGEVVEVDLPDDLDFGPTTSMGRAPAEDPGFFAYAAAAGVLAAQMVVR